MEWAEAEFRIVCRPLSHRMRCLGWALIEHSRPGKFDAARAEQLGIPVGPERALLIQGKPVTLQNGRTIQPEQVVGPPRAGHHIAYCVDTVPTQNAIELARHADLLIHDATFSDEEAQWARKTGHSTAREAAGIARQAGVRQLALTHISGRFMPRDNNRLLNEAREVFPKTILAQDLMRIKIEYEEK